MVFGGSTALLDPASFGTAGSLNDLYEVLLPTNIRDGSHGSWGEL